MEAGLEHLSRSDGTLRHVDGLLVVVEPYARAIETARRTAHLATQLGIPRVHAVASKVRGAGDAARVTAFASQVGLPILGLVAFDDAVLASDRVSGAVLDAAPDAPAVQAIDRLLDALKGALEDDRLPVRG